MDFLRNFAKSHSSFHVLDYFFVPFLEEEKSKKLKQLIKIEASLKKSTKIVITI